MSDDGSGTREGRGIVDDYVDVLCSRFERAWIDGRPQTLEQCLSECEAFQKEPVLHELLLVELELRRKKGEQPEEREYLDRFPSFADVVSDAFGRTMPRLGPPPTLCEPQGLHVRCPNCHLPLEVPLDTSLTDLACISCGSHFSLIDHSQDPRAEVPLSTLGRFELMKRVGVGGFGTVWKARDKELDRTVAIKIPRRGSMSADEQEMFFREARAAAQLRHPNIVSVHEVGRDGGSVFIVSDFVYGVTMSDWLAYQQLTGREAAEMSIKIAEALHHAHEHGVVHRDLKPVNILIDGEGEPHLTDFGLARRELGEVTMTMDGQVLGTPAYMPPEQAQGEAHRADRRSDVYSLGVILFEMLTRERPFRGNVRMLIHQVVHDEAPSPRKFNATIPKDLETIILKCLEKVPGKRYETARHLAEDLRRWLDHLPIAARPISQAERAWRWCRRNSVYAALSVLIVFVSLLGFLGVVWQLEKTIQAETDRRLAEVESLKTAESAAVPERLQALDLSEPDVVMALRELAEVPRTKVRVRAKAAILRLDPSMVDGLYQELLRVEPQEFVAIRAFVESLPTSASGQFQTLREGGQGVRATLTDADAPDNERLLAAALLRNGSEFDQQADVIAKQLLDASVNRPESFPHYLAMFRGCSVALADSLERIFDDPSALEQQRTNSAIFLAEYLDDPEELAALAIRATVTQFKQLIAKLTTRPTERVRDYFLEFINNANNLSETSSARPDSDSTLTGTIGFLRDEQAIQVANAAIALMRLDDPQPARELLKFRDDPAIRSHLIDRIPKLGLPPSVVVQRMLPEQDPGIRSASLLILGGYGEAALRGVRSEVVDATLEFYQRDPHSGVHAAAGYLLRRWGEDGKVGEVNALFEARQPGVRMWWMNAAGQTMVKVSPSPMAKLNGMLPARSYAISSTETTFEQLEALTRAEPWLRERWTYDPFTNGSHCPAVMITWSEAANWCNLLSEKEGIPEDQWCYEQAGEDNNLPLLVAKPDAERLLGYRLPSVSEWEYACSGGSAAARFFADEPGLLSNYAWWGANTVNGQVRPVASKLPNQFGMFDMYGNAIEWCQDEVPTSDADLLARQSRGLGAGDYLPDRTRPKVVDYGINRNVAAGGYGFRVAKTLD